MMLAFTLDRMNSDHGPPRWSTKAMLEASADGDLPMAANRIACRSIPVLPCAPGGKQPLTARGFYDAPTDLDRVRGWWRQNPAANIGIPTGGPSGVLVVDVDVHEAGSGLRALRSRTVGWPCRRVGLADAHAVAWAACLLSRGRRHRAALLASAG